MNELNKKRAGTVWKLSQMELNGYSDENQSRKEEWMHVSYYLLRAIGVEIGLKPMKVHKTKGGIAISGDISLMGMLGEGHGIAIYFGSPRLFGGPPSFYYRRISSMTDHAAAGNQTMTHEELARDPEAAIQTMLRRVGWIREMI